MPTFADPDELSKLLQDNDVIVQAKPINAGGLLVNILLGFGPVILLVGLFVFLARRAGAGGGMGGLGAFSRSQGAARRGRRARGSRSPTSPASTRRRPS